MLKICTLHCLISEITDIRNDGGFKLLYSKLVEDAKAESKLKTKVNIENAFFWIPL